MKIIKRVDQHNRKLTPRLTGLLLCLAAFLLTAGASAAPLTYTLSAVTLSDGSTASGSFQYDAATNTYSGVNITTTAGSLPGATYNTVSSGFPPDQTGVLLVTGPGSQTGLPGLALFFTPVLNGGGGSTNVSGQESTCADAGCSVPTGTTRTVTAGSASAGPAAQPLTWYLSGVTFADGSTATGSFTFSAATDTFSNVNITTTTGTRAGATYNSVSSGIPASSTGALYVTSGAANQTGLPAFALFFSPALTGAGGTSPVTGQEANCGDPGCSSPAGTMRFISGGIVTTVFPGSVAPSFSKTFGAISIGSGATTSLTFAISNPNPVALTAVAFSDTLPAGLLVATPNGLTGACGGGGIVAIAGGNTINLSGATVPANGNCTFTVNVKGNAPGLQTNITSTLTSVQAPAGNVATASLFVGDPFQVTYVSNLASGDSFLDITNAGTLGAALPSGTTATVTGAICANVYAFTPDEQLVSCCSCPVTPNGLVSLSAQNDLTSNTLTPAIATALVVKVIATVPAGGSCANSAAAIGTLALANGIKSFGTTIHATPVAGTFGVTERPFSAATLSAGELGRLGNLCNFILANGSGFGVCRTCKLGGLGSDRQ